jgi:multidrug efflux pump subunit AcrB
MVTVSSQLAPGSDYSELLDELTPRLAALELPSGVRWNYGGAVEGAGEANLAIAAAAPLGGLLLLFFVLLEFNSFRRVAIILSTVPLAAAGVVPGLLLGGQPFGFMSLLGVFALIGIVVNNAIVLLHVVEERRAGGASVAQALREAVELRTRPILLTSATTVAGLMPLALSDSPLWPPMAFAMITGLTASTLLTLLVVPALYTLAFREATPVAAV